MLSSSISTWRKLVFVHELEDFNMTFTLSDLYVEHYRLLNVLRGLIPNTISKAYDGMMYYRCAVVIDKIEFVINDLFEHEN